MGIIDTLKDVVVLVQKTDNIDVVRQVIALQGQVYELVTENGNLKAELQRERDVATMRAAMRFEKNAYWQGPEGPFCSKCWDAEGKRVRVHLSKGRYPQCPACKTQILDPDAPPASPVFFI
jgi:hypothetical protein